MGAVPRADGQRCTHRGRGGHDRPEGPRRASSGGRHIAAHFAQLGDRPRFSEVTPVARLVTDDFLAGQLRRDRRRLLDVRLDPQPACGNQAFLPVSQSRQEAGEDASNDEYLFEPSADAVLRRLLPHYVAIDLYRAFLENQASEESARMIAMRSATDNANELIEI